jgi:aquaporin Z
MNKKKIIIINSNNMAVKAILAEFMGTFFFLSVILNAVADVAFGPIAVAIGLLAAIYFGGKVSGGHFNPAVSIMMYVKGKLTGDLTILYISAQIIGALCALVVNNFFYL